MEAALKLLQDGKPTRILNATLSAEQKPIFKAMQLLTSKPVLYVCNVEEKSAAAGNAYSQKVEALAKSEKTQAVIVSAAIEAEVAILGNPDDQKEFLSSMGLEEAGLNRVIRAGFSLLNLITFFTAGPKETRAWTLLEGSRAPQGAGVIHTDFEKGFIKAEIIDYQSFVTLGGESACRDAGKLRMEGKDYIIQDGDICHFRFNV
jgi:ribosome-binding ATPase YchF (GTP1/OBG family)